MSNPRETAMQALFTKVSAAFAWGSTPSRRLKLWSDVPTSQRPALFQHEGGEDHYTSKTAVQINRTIKAKLFIYIDAKGTGKVGASQINDILDSIDAALLPSGMDAAQGRQTLTGSVYDCRIEGNVIKDPGDLDGDGLIIIPISMVLP